jgi:hypothetical protein
MNGQEKMFDFLNSLFGILLCVIMLLESKYLQNIAVCKDNLQIFSLIVRKWDQLLLFRLYLSFIAATIFPPESFAIIFA